MGQSDGSAPASKIAKVWGPTLEAIRPRGWSSYAFAQALSHQQITLLSKLQTQRDATVFRPPTREPPMARLSASTEARISLEWRNLEERAAVVRGRVEALPRAYLDGPMRAAENRIRLRQMDKARDALDDIDSRLDAHIAERDRAEVAAATVEQEKLLAERGVETFDVGAVKARDGWQWLITRKPPRLSHDQVDAGNAYGKLFAQALRDDMSSSANDNCGIEGSESPVDARMKARRRLDNVRAHINGATGSTRLVGLLDAVCGRGDTLRALAGNDDRKAGGYEIEFKIALDMAGVAIRLAKRAEDEAKRRAA